MAGAAGLETISIQRMLMKPYVTMSNNAHLGKTSFSPKLSMRTFPKLFSQELSGEFQLNAQPLFADLISRVANGVNRKTSRRLDLLVMRKQAHLLRVRELPVTKRSARHILDPLRGPSGNSPHIAYGDRGFCL